MDHPERSPSPSPRTALRRHAERAVEGREALHALLDACLVVHVAAPGPRILPMAFGRIGDTLYLHGAIAHGLFAAANVAGGDVAVCATVTDGLVLARSAFRHSMNYRSAVIYGRLRVVEGAEKLRALDAVLEHALPGRASEVRASNEAELAATQVVALDLGEASVKARRGAPNDLAGDLASGAFAGILPLTEGVAAYELADGSPDVPPPSVVAATLARAPRLAGERTHDGFRLAFDPRAVPLETLYTWLADTYWSQDLDRGRLLRAIAGAQVVTAHDGAGTFRGFARLVTDGETFGWLADVYVDAPCRGRGLGRALADALVSHPRFARLRRVMLGTRDAHRTYAPLGFEPLPDGWFLQRRSA